MDSLVFSNMLHRPVRTLVSILGIAIGVLLIVFTVGMANGSLREQGNREANVGAQLLFCAEGSRCFGGSDSFRVPVTITQDLAKIEGVKAAIAIGQTSVDTKDTNTGKRPIDGVKFEEYAQMSGLKIIEGRPFTDNTDEAIIDTAWQQQKNLKLGDKLPLYEREFTIVGTYEPAGGARLKIPLSTMQAQLGGEGKATTILVSIKDGYNVDQVGENIKKTFPDNLLIRTKDLEEFFMQGFPALNVFLNVIIGVAAAISALVILLTMYTTVTERTRQIGVLKSLGMSNTNIGWIITQEALLLSFLGIVSGIILTLVLRFILSCLVTLQVEINPVVLTIVFFVGLLGGAAGALYPAMKAARMDAVEALSYE